MSAPFPPLSTAARDAYLARIGCTGVPAPDHAALAALQRAHLLTVPFENLDIHLGVPIELDLERILAKLVARRRGGFCYELNGAFAALLSSLGFRVQLLEARVHGPAGLGIPHDHLCLAVLLERPFLADVGFGECFRAPLELRAGATLAESGGAYRLAPVAGGALDLVRDAEPLYRFERTARAFEEFRAACRHHQTSPASHFTRKTLVSLATETGRITLSGKRWIERDGAHRSERDLAPDEWRRTLLERFGIALDAESLTRLG